MKLKTVASIILLTSILLGMQPLTASDTSVAPQAQITVNKKDEDKHPLEKLGEWMEAHPVATTLICALILYYPIRTISDPLVDKWFATGGTPPPAPRTDIRDTNCHGCGNDQR